MVLQLSAGDCIHKSSFRWKIISKASHKVKIEVTLKEVKLGQIIIMTILLVVKDFLIICCHLVKIRCTNCQKHQELKMAENQLQQYTTQIGNLAAVQEQNRIAHNLYDALGHSIAALHIQLQVAHKLWQVDPTQAQQSLSEAYQLSTTLMQEVRQAVRKLNQDHS